MNAGITWKQTLIGALVIACGCAAMVWWLERFEVAKLHTAFQDYLEKHDRFRAWEAEHGD